MTDEHYRAINRAIAYVGYLAGRGPKADELQDIREEARTALHHIFGREKRLREENRDLMDGALRDSTELARLRAETEEYVEHLRLALRDNRTQAEELTRLREEYGAYQTTLLDELAKLREDYQSLSDQANEELTRLREQVDKMHRERGVAGAELAKLRAEVRDYEERIVPLAKAEYAELQARLTEAEDNPGWVREDVYDDLRNRFVALCIEHGRLKYRDLLDELGDG